jgi:single-strand DNA-binding protein
MNANEGINKIILMGALTREPRWQGNGAERWLYFTMMTRENGRSERNPVEHEEIHQVKIAEKCPAIKNLTLKKNDMVLLEGKIKTHSFIDDNKVKRYRTEVVGYKLELIGSRF